MGQLKDIWTTFFGPFAKGVCNYFAIIEENKLEDRRKGVDFLFRSFTNNAMGRQSMKKEAPGSGILVHKEMVLQAYGNPVRARSKPKV